MVALALFLPSALALTLRTPMPRMSGTTFSTPGSHATTYTDLSPFAAKALEIVSNHRIVKSNPYCEWFGKGEVRTRGRRAPYPPSIRGHHPPRARRAHDRCARAHPHRPTSSSRVTW